MNFRWILPVFFLLVICGCDDEIQELPQLVDGLRPVYAADSSWRIVEVLPPRVQTRQGAEIVDNNIRYSVEPGFGVHVVDEMNPVIPVLIAFISIPGVDQLDILFDMLVASNYTDVVQFDISDPYRITLAERVENVYLPEEQQRIPDDYIGFIECPDPDRGIILGWQFETLNQPNCWK